MRSFLLLLLLPACTTIHSVGGGARAGEFYAVAETKGESYVIRCQEIVDPLGTELVCTRVLVASEAGQLAPAENPSGRVKFTRVEKP